MMSRHLARFFAHLSVLTAACWVSATASAQNAELDQLLQIGAPDSGATLAVPMGEVNLSNGNLHLEIPIKTIPQRGSSPPLVIKMVYDSKFWEIFSRPNGDTYWIPGGTQGYGWQLIATPESGYATAVETDVLDTSTCNTTGYGTVPSWSNFSYSVPSGATHVFNFQLQQIPPCDGTQGPSTTGQYATDGSGYYMAVTTDQYGAPDIVTVWDPHGDQVSRSFLQGGGDFQDSNGNSLTNPYLQNGPLSIPGISSQKTTFYVNLHFSGGNNEYSDQLVDMSSLTLPDGRSYSFKYDQCPGTSACSSTDYHYGVLTQMTLPTGATVTFNYQDMSANYGGFDVGDLRVTSVSLSGEPLGNCASNSSWSGQTWSLCYQLSNSPYGYPWTTEVHITQPPDSTSTKNELVYTGGPGPEPGNGPPPTFQVSTKSTYAGLAQSGKLMRKVTLSYDAYNRIDDVATLLDDQTSTHIGYSYWGNQDVADYNLPLVSSKKEYGASNQLLRETDITYTTNYGYGTMWNGSYHDFPHFIDRPLTAAIYGPGGPTSAPLAKTIYNYDENALSTTSGSSGHSVLGLSSHDDANFGASVSARGNLTSTSRMVQPGQFITTQTNYYNILGELVSHADGNGNTTQYDYYSGSWGDSSCSSVMAFNYQTALTNPLGQQTHTTYNSCDGSVYSVQDQNDLNANRAGTVYSYDSSWRVQHVNYPDGSSKGIDYGGSSVPVVITTTVPTDSTSAHSLVTTQTQDGLGRIIRTVSPSGSTTDTTFDNLGNVYCVSTPYIGTSTGSTCTSYDVLNRVTQVLAPGESGANAGVRYQYSGDTTDMYDEANLHWKRTVDDLGRLSTVQELGTTSSPLNLTTTYSYNPLDDLTNVSQNGTTGDAARERYFAYDSLSRMISACNPEDLSGVLCDGISQWSTTYSYDNDGNATSKTDARGVVTHYGFDNDGRLISKTYTGTNAASNAIAGATLSSCYQYDANGSSTSAENSIGRLVNEWTIAGACVATLPTTGYLTLRSVLEYDPMGRIEREQQCHFHNCTSGSPFSAETDFDFAGHQTFYKNNVHPIGISDYFDSTGRLQSLGSSLVDGTHPATLLSVGSYSPANAIQTMTLGPNINVTRTYDNRLRITGGTAQHPQ